MTIGRDSLRTALLTGSAMVCFAANSLLCRAALRPGLLDAATFTLVRVGSGAAVLAAVMLVRAPSGLRSGTWTSAAALFAYAAAFSLAYVRLHTGVGALLLFASVQGTMLGWSVLHGVGFREKRQWVGVGAASAGLALLTLPGAHSPDAVGAALMIGAGAAWGVYSIRGRSAADPLAATSGNFVRAVPFAAALALAASAPAGASASGVALATLSGAVTSAGGYVLWYAVLPALGPARAGTVQVGVPVLAASAGVALLGEPVTVRLVLAGAAVLGGIALLVQPRGSAERGPAHARRLVQGR